MTSYDRPVWQLMQEFADQCPGEFRFADLGAWFQRCYPAIPNSTLRAHLHRMTNGSSPAGPTRIFERVEHGVYQVARPAESHRMAVAKPDAADIVLVTCVKTKGPAPAPAKDLYISALFKKQRLYAERSGAPWFILSAEYGLVSPDEWLSPYERYLPDCPQGYQHAWAKWVAARLELLQGSLRGRVIELHASALYAARLAPELQRLSATVATPLAGLSQGARLAWYDESARERPAQPASASEPSATISVSSLVDVLSKGEYARRPAELRLERPALGSPGLYSWWADETGAADLSSGLERTVDPGLIYAGQAGATRWPSGRRSANTLWLRLVGMHLDGSAEFSTFRRTLGAVLTEPLGLGHADDPALTQWIEDHLSVTAVPVDDPDGLMAIERQVLAELDPPLNLSGRPSTPVRRRVSELRRLARAKANLTNTRRTHRT